MIGNDHFVFDQGAASDVGCRREINEDSFLAQPTNGLWAVADGMGGHAAGDFASQTIVAQLSSIGPTGSPEDQQARFMERLTRANDAILAHSAALGRGSIGSTVVSLLVHGHHFACIWSGDSRAYLFRDGALVQQSRDHTEVRALLDAGVITIEDALRWPRKNVITKAVGVTAEPECETVTGDIRADDFFLLCSDGLTEHLDDHDILSIMGSAPSSQSACDRMIAETLVRGAKDNVTVVAIRCLAAPPPEPGDEGADIMDDMA